MLKAQVSPIFTPRASFATVILVFVSVLNSITANADCASILSDQDVAILKALAQFRMECVAAEEPGLRSVLTREYRIKLQEALDHKIPVQAELGRFIQEARDAFIDETRNRQSREQAIEREESQFHKFEEAPLLQRELEDPTMVGALAPDGKTVALARVSTQNRIKKSFIEILNLERPHIVIQTGGLERTKIKSLVFNQSGSLVIGWLDLSNSGKNFHQVITWDVATGKELARTAVFAEPITSLVADPIESDRFTLTLANGVANRLSAMSGALKLDYSIPRMASVAALSPDGRYAVFPGADGFFTIWDNQASQNNTNMYQRLFLSRGPFYSATFDRQGRYLVLTRDNELVVHRWSDHTTRKTIEGQGYRTAKLSPNGLWLAVGKSDGTVQIYDANTWQLLQTFFVHRQIQNLTFTPDSQAILIQPSNGPVSWWKVKSEPPK